VPDRHSDTSIMSKLEDRRSHTFMSLRCIGMILLCFFTRSKILRTLVVCYRGASRQRDQRSMHPVNPAGEPPGRLIYRFSSIFWPFPLSRAPGPAVQSAEKKNSVVLQFLSA
jgi:hypothetical protein